MLGKSGLSETGLSKTEHSETSHTEIGHYETAPIRVTGKSSSEVPIFTIFRFWFNSFRVVVILLSNSKFIIFKKATYISNNYTFLFDMGNLYRAFSSIFHGTVPELIFQFSITQQVFRLET